MGFIKQTPTLSEEYSQPLIEDFIASSSDNNSNGRSSSTRDESDQRLNAPIEDVNAQELDLRQKVSRSHQRILRLRIISLLTTIVSAIGFLRRGNAGSLLKISPDVHQSKIQLSTTPLMMFGWTAILSGLIQLVCVILHVSGPWSRACHIRGISKVLVAIDRSILEPINPTDMEQVSQVSVAKALPVVIWLRLLLCDILVTNILVLSLVAINQLEEAEGYVGMNIFGILNRILAIMVLWAAEIEQWRVYMVTIKYTGVGKLTLAFLEGRILRDLPSALILRVLASVLSTFAVSPYFMVGNRKILELDYPNLVLIFNAFILALHLLRIVLHILTRPIETPQSEKISQPSGKTPSQSRSFYWLISVGRWMSLLVDFVRIPLHLAYLPSLETWGIALGLVAGFLHVLAVVEDFLDGYHKTQDCCMS